MSVLLLIIGLLLFVGLVVVHEFGHFIMAKRNGVEVEEFGIGFPPRAKTLKIKNGTRYTLNWLPLGGFVKLKGEHDSDTEPGTFGAASLWAKTKIMAAGVVMNLLAAFVLLALLAAVGIPRLLDNQFTVKNDTKIIRQDVYIGYVEPGSPAEKAGLAVKDQLLYIERDCGSLTVCVGEENSRITTVDNFPGQTKSRAGQKV
jgi:regulator of sigma E protease